MNSPDPIFHAGPYDSTVDFGDQGCIENKSSILEQSPSHEPAPGSLLGMQTKKQ